MARSKVDPHHVPDTEWARAVAREPVFRRLADRPRLNELEVDDALDELGLGRSQFYALLRRYREQPVTSSLVPSSPGPRPGSSRLSPAVDKQIEHTIDRFHLRREKPKIAALWREVRHDCKAAGLPVPSAKAVAARAARSEKKRRTRAREGRKAADDAYRPVVHNYTADYALQIVQIDHTLVDVVIVDDWTRQPLCRPWLTLAICIASRMVTGFYLTLDHPSAISVAMAVRHAALPKDRWLADRGIAAPWPVGGLPDMLHMDNAKEFHSRALRRGCSEHGIGTQYRPPATPHFGGHIERLIGTIMGEVHLLPGTTFSDVAERGDYDAESASFMTLSELETWLAIQIVGIYHVQRHAGIMLPPNAAWTEAVARRPAPIRRPVDEAQFLLDFLPFEYRKVRRDGIRLFNIRYWDPVLSVWTGEGTRLPVKYDPRNLSRIYLQAPGGEHWPISYADLRRPPITLWEHHRAMASLRERGKTAVDEQLIFDAIEAQRLITAEAASKTKQARKQLARTTNALRAGDDPVPEPQALSPADGQLALPGGDPYLPYDVEEWS